MSIIMSYLYLSSKSEFSFFLLGKKSKKIIFYFSKKNFCALFSFLDFDIISKFVFFKEILYIIISSIISSMFVLLEISETKIKLSNFLNSCMILKCVWFQKQNYFVYRLKAAMARLASRFRV